ncbi:hypothetical protein [Aeromonas veronii]|uniref:hypothetical protein n=1 Tax=Aeromonas veronii TaxID=654 RepID=UPI0014313ACE|nr:hypothetical protein [Aeromonas veronii]NJI10811.1 hypothetical protein [Aeromonas veronii]
MTEPLLQQAIDLFDKEGPFTLADVHQLEQLEAKANGEELSLIGEMWEAAMVNADEEALHYMTTIEDDA